MAGLEDSREDFLVWFGDTGSLEGCCLVSKIPVGCLDIPVGYRKGLLQEVSDLFEGEFESDRDASEDLSFVVDFLLKQSVLDGRKHSGLWLKKTGMSSGLLTVWESWSSDVG